MDRIRYKINIHAHSFFSDGQNSPYIMAKTAQSLGFSALVLTDHYYNGSYPEVSMVKSKEGAYKRALKEAEMVLPVIRGTEATFGGEEILVFGQSAIKEIMDKDGIQTDDHLKEIRKNHECAIVLCHPGNYYEGFTDLFDGYERYNSGSDEFATRPEALDILKDKQAWYNSDAHGAVMLPICYNLTEDEITTEEQLIAYIKSGKVNDYEVTTVEEIQKNGIKFID